MIILDSKKKVFAHVSEKSKMASENGSFRAETPGKNVSDVFVFCGFVSTCKNCT